MTSGDGNDILRENGWETSEDFRRSAFPSQLGNLLMEVITALGKAEFGLPEGFCIYTLQNANGIRVKITNFGAAVMEVHAPDRDKNLADVALGFGDYTGYLENVPSLGVVVGRYANRIANGTFTLNGRHYTLAANHGDHHLHGGVVGFGKRLWRGVPFETAEAGGVKLRYTSRDGEEGYPGQVQTELIYSLTESNELRMEYRAVSDQSTPLNLTNHAYWNLGGEGSGFIGGHILTIYADYYTPSDNWLIPTGEIRSVAETPLDFRRPKAVESDMEKTGGNLTGYDHNFVLNKSEFGALELAATIIHPASGRRMDVLTTEPGIQFYTGNSLDGTIVGKSGAVYGPQSGFCLECQHFPDSPNHPHFPSTILRPEQEYTQTTIHKFSIAD